jgi:hypothetical protein
MARTTSRANHSPPVSNSRSRSRSTTSTTSAGTVMVIAVIRWHRKQAAWFALSVGTIPGLAEDEESERARSEARSRGGLGQRTMAMIEAGQDVLILKRASASRSSGEWSDDDYDVLAESVVVGRIFKVDAAPVGSPWMWTLMFPHHEGRCPTHGYAARAPVGYCRPGSQKNRHAGCAVPVAR